MGSLVQLGKVQLDGVVGILAVKAKDFYLIDYNVSNEVVKSGKFLFNILEADKVVNFNNLFLVKNNCEVIFAKRHDSSNGLIGGGNSWVGGSPEELRRTKDPHILRQSIHRIQHEKVKMLTFYWFAISAHFGQGFE